MATIAHTGSKVAVAAFASLRRRWLAVVLAIALNVGDAVSTHLGLRLGLPEGNLIPHALIDRWGELSFFGFKLGLIAAVILIVCLLEARYPRLWQALYVTNLVLAVVILSNSVQVLGRL